MEKNNISLDVGRIALQIDPHATRTSNGWKLRCPAHDDRNPSCVIAAGDRVPLIAKCFAKCATEDILNAIAQKTGIPRSAFGGPRRKTPARKVRHSFSVSWGEGFDGGATSDVATRGGNWEGLAALLRGKVSRKNERFFSPGVQPVADENAPGTNRKSSTGYDAEVLVFDFDGEPVVGPDGKETCNGTGVPMTKVDAVLEELAELGFAFIASTSFSHAMKSASGCARFRLALRFEQPVTGVEYKLAWELGAAWLRERGLHPDPAPSSIASVFFIGRVETHERDWQRIHEGGGLDPVVMFGAEPPWPDPTPLEDGGQAKLPLFPLENIPRVISDISKSLAAATCSPVEIPLLYALGELHAIVQRSHKLWVRESTAWFEMMGQYIVIVARSGEAKSPNIRALSKPRREWEKVERKRDREKAAEHAAKVDTVAALLKEAKSEDERIDAYTLQMELEANPPLPACIAVEDCTPEALVEAVAEQPTESMAILSDEAVVLEAVTGTRYNSEKGKSNLSALCKLHSGAELRVKRKGKPLLVLDQPVATVCVAGQPDALRRIQQIPGAKEQGLLARMLYVRPLSLVGFRDYRASPPVPREHTEAWDALVNRLLDTGNGSKDRTELHLSDEALNKLLDLRQDVEARMGPAGDLAEHAEWGNRIAGNIARFAALFGLVASADPLRVRTIEARHMTQAVCLAPVLIEHAKLAFRMINEADAHALALLEWACAKEKQVFSKRDVQVAMPSRFRKADEIDGPLAVLFEHGWIRPLPEEPRSPNATGRKSSPRFTLHPEAAAFCVERPPSTESTLSTEHPESPHSVESVESVEGGLSPRTPIQDANGVGVELTPVQPSVGVELGKPAKSESADPMRADYSGPSVDDLLDSLADEAF